MNDIHARVELLEDELARFHAEASGQSHVWKDPSRGEHALMVARELRDTIYDADQRTLRRPGGPSMYSGEAIRLIPRASNPAAEGIRAFAARETFYDSIDQLRASTDEAATRYARRIDRAEVARLRWLLDLLREVQPEAAQHIDDDWSNLKSQMREAKQGGEASTFLSRPGRYERWVRDTGDGLILFLEPLLPA